MKKCGIHTVDFLHLIGNCNETKNNFCDYKYEIIYVVSGAGSFCVEGAEIQFDSNSFLVVKPLTYYTINASEEVVFSRYSITFSYDDISDFLLSSINSLFTNNATCAIIKDFNHDELDRIIAGISFADKLSGESRNQYLTSLLSQILILLISAKTKFSYLNSNEITSQITDFITDNLKNGKVASLDEIAKSFFVSKFYLCRVFKKCRGVSIHSYINQKRIMIAKQYIDSGVSAKVASELVGYMDYSSFYRAYVKVVGQSPKSQKGE